MAITVPYKVMPKGYQISGDVRSGFKATVPYLVAWTDAFHFADQVIGGVSATRAGRGWSINFRLPYQFPASVAPLYAQRFTIEPCGANGTAISSTTKGLAPGEFFDHAIVRVEFETPQGIQQMSDDASGANQLDPTNPLTYCEQSVKMQGKMMTLKSGSYLYVDTTPVIGDFSTPISDSKLVLKFPRVPYLPWQVLQPFINTVNLNPILGTIKGQCLLEGMDTVYTAMTDGTIGQAVTLEMSVNAMGDWNSIPKPDGTPSLVYKKGLSNTDANRIYGYADFSQIFANLQFTGS